MNREALTQNPRLQADQPEPFNRFVCLNWSFHGLLDEIIQWLNFLCLVQDLKGYSSLYGFLDSIWFFSIQSERCLDGRTYVQLN